MSRTIEIDGLPYTLPFRAVGWVVEDSTQQVFVNAETDADANYITAALNDYRPWRYPSRGEWPRQTGEYEVTTLHGAVIKLRFNGRAKFVDVIGTLYDVRAFRELPEPAPVIEKGESK